MKEATWGWRSLLSTYVTGGGGIPGLCGDQGEALWPPL